MSILLQARELAHSAGDRLLFSGLTVVLAAGDRVGLVGHNGSGKSTLLTLLAGTREPDSGEVERRRGLRLALVEQFLPESLAATTLAEAVVARVPDGERWQAEALLARFGFAPDEFGRLVGTLSGGQQNRLMFARALASDPELLLLDEPTNHMDLRTLMEFEAALRDYRGAVLLVSHDRAFLDSVTRETLFLRDGGAYRFSSPYGKARRELEAMDEANARARMAEQRKIDALRISARRLATWGKVYDNEGLARRARSMHKRIDRLEERKTFVTRGSPLDLNLTLGDSRARQVLAVEGLDVRVPGRRLFHVDELIVRPGERVALLGHNGVGKTTFVNMLVDAFAAESGVSGVRVSPQTTLGYYDQELDGVTGSSGMLRFVCDRVQAGEQTVRGQLIKAGFAYEAHDKRVDTLSGGERARLLFVVLAMQRPNFLVLDEPTNHIDIDGKEQLEQQLLESGATLLITSHDRRFLEIVADRYLLVDGGRLRELMSLQDFFATPGDAAGDAGPQSATPGGAAAGPADASADRALARIVELEELLEADLARKPRFQKPAFQAQWREELERLYARLDD